MNSILKLLLLSLMATMLAVSCSDFSDVRDPDTREDIAEWYPGESSMETLSSEDASSGASSSVEASSSMAASSAKGASSATETSSSSAKVTLSSSSIVAASSATETSSSSAKVTSSSSGVVVVSSATETSSSSADVIYGSLGNMVDRAGKSYQSVTIGTQTWMAENLNYPTTTGSFCKSDADVTGVTSNTTYCDTYGRVYDYVTALTVCPSGWHLPSDAEWQTLEIKLGMAQVDANDVTWRGTDQGIQLKSNSTLWPSSANAGTNTSKFSALPGGYYYGASFGSVGTHGYWWTATSDGSSQAYSRGMSHSYASVYRKSSDQSYGFSVRCLKDSN